ncbi:MAG: phosphotransferase enzyme family protein [Planctomycetaceae bacterium]|jgi:hypothetical protein
MPSLVSTCFDLWQRFFAPSAHVQGLPVEWSEPEQPGLSGAVVLKLAVGDRAWCLKGTPASRFEPDRVAELHRLTAWLGHRGLTQLAVPLVTTGGATWVEQADWVWQCEPWLPGAPLTVGEVLKDELEQAARLVADWHRHASDYCPTPRGERWFASSDSGSPVGVRERLTRLSDWPEPRCRLLRSRLAAGPGRESRWQAAAERVLTVAEQEGPRLAEELRAAQSLRVRLLPCLRDVWRPHVLFEQHRLVGLIDLQASRTECVAADLSRLLGSLAPRRRDLWQAGLAAYEQVRPLGASERVLLPVYDRSGCLLAALHWVEWLLSRGPGEHETVERGPFARGTGLTTQAAERLVELSDRLEHGLPGEAWPS